MIEKNMKRIRWRYKMKRHKLFSIIALLIIIICLVLYMLIPQYLVKNSENVYSIEIQYAKHNGKIITITDANDINNLMESLKPIKIKFRSFLIGNGGWTYTISFYNGKGKQIQKFVIINSNEITKYTFTSWKIDTDKNIPCESIEAFWEKYSPGL